jgi:DNA-binding transcriptional ArsR family regulator
VTGRRGPLDPVLASTPKLDIVQVVSRCLPLVNTYLLDGWAALGDPTRRTIFARLAAAPSAVGELADTLPVSRPAVSQHLKVLKTAGLVIDERDGARRIYRVDQSGLRQMRAELDVFWNETLAAYKRVVEETDLTSQGHRHDVHRPQGEQR